MTGVARILRSRWEAVLYLAPAIASLVFFAVNIATVAATRDELAGWISVVGLASIAAMWTLSYWYFRPRLLSARDARPLAWHEAWSLLFRDRYPEGSPPTNVFSSKWIFGALAVAACALALLVIGFESFSSEVLVSLVYLLWTSLGTALVLSVVYAVRRERAKA
jgi:hypothetical protein